MGLPMGKLVVATNANDILARFWRGGAYEKVDSSSSSSGVVVVDATAPVEGASDGKQAVDASGVKETLSPAMDILVSSNFERLLWYLAREGGSLEGEGDDSTADDDRRRKACGVVEEWMKKVKSDGRVQVPTKVLELARRDFLAERVSDEQTLKTIRSFFNSDPLYIADPHTAVGLTAAGIIAPNNPEHTIQIVLSTAHPAKFSEAVTKALQGSPSFNFERDVLPVEFQGLLEKKRNVIDVEAAEVELVKEVIERFAVDEQGEQDMITGSV